MNAKLAPRTVTIDSRPRDSYVIGAAWNDMISSYKSSLSCSLLISSLCTGAESRSGVSNLYSMTHDQIRRTGDLEEVQRARHRGHAVIERERVRTDHGK